MKIKFLDTFLFAWYYIASAQVTVKNLRCEMFVNPLGIDAYSHGLAGSWKVTKEMLVKHLTRLL